MNQVATFPIIGTDVSAVSMPEALGTIEQAIAEGTPNHVCVCSVNMLMQARENPTLRQALEQARLVVPDGMPLARVGRRRAGDHVERIRGTDLVHAFSELAAERGYRTYFYGGAEGVAERMAEVLCEQYPGLEVAGIHSPPFRPLTPEEDAAIVEEINASGADLAWVGLGCPKQEAWMVEHSGRIKAPVMVGVGAAFDFISGDKPEAPEFVRGNFEWLWRFASEPTRLWRRVLVEGPQFAGLLAMEELQRLAQRGR